MGIKENFTQAVKELTGIGDDNSSGGTGGTVDGLRKGVFDETPPPPREIKLDAGNPVPVRKPDSAPAKPVEEWDEDYMASTVRPITADESAYVSEDSAETTPAAEEFLSGGEVPTSLFGGKTHATAATPTVASGGSPLYTQPPVAPKPEFGGGRQAPPPPPTAPIPPFGGNSGGFGGNTGGFGGGNTGFNNRNAVPARITPHSAGSEDNELTIISRNTIIDGNIRSFANMSIDGDIKGNVETTKDIDLNGKIVGDITCNNAMMHTSQVQGNIRMKGNVSMKRDTLLIGDLMSTYAEVNGKIKGNLDVVGKADLRGDAVVFGDISASTITVEDGAIIQGYVSTTFLNKEESRNLFPETIIIGGEA